MQERSIKRIILVCSVLCLLAAAAFANNNTKEENIDRGIRFTETNPPVAPVRPIAEFEPASAVLIRYPLGIPLSLVVQLANTANVICIVSSSQQNSAISAFTNAGVNMDKVNFINTITDSYWTRDYGPWFIFDGNGEYGVVDFVYNRPRPNDNLVPQIFANQLNLNYYGMNLQQTGGNYMCDGVNTAAQTNLVYSENGNNQTNVNTKMNQYLGITNYCVVADPNNTYIDHIDCWAKFLAPDKILIRSVPISHPQYNAIETTATYFANQNCAWGYPYRVYRVNTPNNEPYTNSLILNKKVFVPIVGSSNDNPALQVYRTAMPGYEVIGISQASSTPWESTDALHCRTHEIPDKNMLHIVHTPWHSIISAGTDIVFNVEITAHSGQPLYTDSLFVCYKVNSGDWQRSYLQPLTRNNYTTSLSGFSYGDSIRYFIHAADQSGRNADHPVFASLDPHLFVIQPDTTPPNLVHNPITTIGNQTEPISFILSTNDESGINQVLFRYHIDNSAISSFPMDPIFEDTYIFQYYPEFGSENRSFFYSFAAYDSVNPPNIGYLPGVDLWYEVPIRPVAITDEVQTPSIKEGLISVYPNPFQAGKEVLNLRYFTEKQSSVTCKIYNIRGQIIYENTSVPKASGLQELVWNGKDKQGYASPNGLYLVELIQGSNRYKAKLIIVK
ncbi:MAG TPA: agmatine deiminase family protein [Candidatus Cloacimonas sp.]|nr:agmatine deiminase family protein [Candidatus Cloacimonas sp.]